MEGIYKKNSIDSSDSFRSSISSDSENASSSENSSDIGGNIECHCDEVQQPIWNTLQGGVFYKVGQSGFRHKRHLRVEWVLGDKSDTHNLVLVVEEPGKPSQKKTKHVMFKDIKSVESLWEKPGKKCLVIHTNTKNIVFETSDFRQADSWESGLDKLLSQLPQWNAQLFGGSTSDHMIY
ncbi:unnamed protein product [Owenia fusiformis]|uniref:PH domain-containing protein n=1 Tax=Owenia fusiformis TaxID=6347 RepID=A0A8S4P002_OWEFU|nr:unnamed protein product [Owenia fusiformis]